MGIKARFFQRTQAEFDVLPADKKVDKGLYFIYDTGILKQYDLANDRFINYGGSVDILQARPTTPIDGKMYIIGTSGNYKLEFYYEGAWETIGGAESPPTTSIHLDGGRADEVYQQDDIIDGGGA